MMRANFPLLACICSERKTNQNNKLLPVGRCFVPAPISSLTPTGAGSRVFAVGSPELLKEPSWNGLSESRNRMGL